MLSEQVQVAPQAWVALLRAHAATTRQLSALLVAEHGLTINDFEALLHLSRAEDRRMRRVDLAGELLLTASGVTRLLDGLEAAGSHVAAVRALFHERFSEEELEQLGMLLRRLPGAQDAADEECSP